MNLSGRVLGQPTREVKDVLRAVSIACDLIRLIAPKETWMKHALVIAAVLALCGSAFAATGPHPAQKKHGVLATVKQDAHQIGSSFRQDMHRIARADKFRQEQAADQRRIRSQTSAMGAGPANGGSAHGRQSRMDAAYANWGRSHH